MTTHLVRSTRLIPADSELVWNFFANARNLGRITPRSVGFEIHTRDPSTREGPAIRPRAPLAPSGSPAAPASEA